MPINNNPQTPSPTGNEITDAEEGSSDPYLAIQAKAAESCFAPHIGQPLEKHHNGLPTYLTATAGGGYYTEYSSGYAIYWSRKTGPRVLTTEVYNKFKSLKPRPYDAQYNIPPPPINCLGFPVSDPITAVNVKGNTWQYTEFQNGIILQQLNQFGGYDNPVEIDGPIWKAWVAWGGLKAELCNCPISDVVPCTPAPSFPSDSPVYQCGFANPPPQVAYSPSEFLYIYWSPTAGISSTPVIQLV